MDVEAIEAKRAQVKELTIRFLLLEKVIEALPVHDDRHKRALVSLNQAIKAVDEVIEDLRAALGDLYSHDMDWPTEEEIRAYGKR